MKSIKFNSFDGKDIEMDVYFPENWTKDDKRGLVMFFFGGSWKFGSPKQFAPHAKEMANNGMIVACPHYRVIDRDNTGIDYAIQDAIHSVAYMYDNAENLGIDKDKIALGGGSAGGFLALACTILDKLIPEKFEYKNYIKALLLCNPAVDIVRSKDRNEALKMSPLTASEISPIHNLKKDMPDTIIFHGIADINVPISDQIKFQAEMLYLENKCELIQYEGRFHGFFNFNPDVCNIMDHYNVLSHMMKVLYEKGFYEIEPITQH